MIRLHFVVEGQTEEAFVNDVVADHLGSHGIVCDARCVLTSKQGSRQFKGGVSRYDKIRRDIRLWMQEDQKADARFATMFDVYRLPADFPGRAESGRIQNAFQKVALLEQSFAADVEDRRFIPYLQLHEFEALLFCDIQCLLLESPEATAAVERLRQSTASVESPELIDDRPEFAPSKRIAAQVPDYAARKASAGPRLARHIGLPNIRAKCPHFAEWLERLERLHS